MTRIERGDGWELRLGRWEDVLADVRCDALITDPPYSAMTHSGHDRGASLARGGYAQRSDGGRDRRRVRQALNYAAWNRRDVELFARHWADNCKGWICAMSDDALATTWRLELEQTARYSFAPVPCVMKGMTVRLVGDGPSSWTVYLNVARPTSYSKWGTLPGAYVFPPRRGGHIGGKPIDLMRAIVRDYSRKGDLICDPCAGGATTLLAAVLEGRRAIGAEVDPKTFEAAVRRLRQGYTPQFDFGNSG